MSLYTYSGRNHHREVGVNLRRSGAAEEKAMSETMRTQQRDTRLEQNWEIWQLEVLDIIRSEYASVLQEVSWHDVDWNAWRPLFDAGYSASDAVLSAFGKVA